MPHVLLHVLHCCHNFGILLSITSSQLDSRERWESNGVGKDGAVFAQNLRGLREPMFSGTFEVDGVQFKIRGGLLDECNPKASQSGTARDASEREF